MINTERLMHSREGFQSIPAAANDAGSSTANREEASRLLEFRTETGSKYLRPSRWDRIRLMWAFRHFHTLPLQLLSHHNQRLIRRLLRSGLVTSDRPVTKDAVFGVVEKPYGKSGSASRAVVTGMEPAAIGVSSVKPAFSAFSGAAVSSPKTKVVEEFQFGYRTDVKKPRESPAEKKAPGYLQTATNLRDILRQHRTALSIAAAICSVVVVASGISLLLTRSTPADEHPAVSPSQALPLTTATKDASNVLSTSSVPLPQAALTPRKPLRMQGELKQVPQSPTGGRARSLAQVQPQTQLQKLAQVNSYDLTGSPARSRAQVQPQTQLQRPAQVNSYDLTGSPARSRAQVQLQTQLQKPAQVKSYDLNTSPDESASPGAPGRLFVSELPQGHMVQPVPSNPDVVGDLRLKALIAPDGSVKDVTVLSGDPQLAKAGIRAVRQWRYPPPQALGHASEAETQIKMSFYGRDAVSITSVPGNPASRLR